MKIRRANVSDIAAVENILAQSEIGRTRFAEILHAALERSGKEYVAAVSGEPAEAVVAYGMVAGTIGTGALYGVVPVSNRVTELLSFAAHDLSRCGAQQIIAEFPDTDEFKPYRDVLLESGYHPSGIVEDFYRDGVAMVILTRHLHSDTKEGLDLSLAFTHV